MANLDASTPQLKVVKRWLDAYGSLDATNLDPLLSKDYKHQSFSEATHPEETKEEHVQKYKAMASTINKYEVRIQHRKTAFELGD